MPPTLRLFRRARGESGEAGEGKPPPMVLWAAPSAPAAKPEIDLATGAAVRIEPKRRRGRPLGRKDSHPRRRSAVWPHREDREGRVEQ